ncbi:hypothetical protein GCM10023321_69820 [Pseudonocardia eucalypti]|uniref:Uncharacterized protein n=1 Tax=Pseudonocardia eucalypti TaxID=648755 RepID=A0ABP9R4C6_9PSEU
MEAETSTWPAGELAGENHAPTNHTAAAAPSNTAIGERAISRATACSTGDTTHMRRAPVAAAGAIANHSTWVG